MILGKQKRGTPGKWDLLLANAETILDLERCPQCNQPKYVCQNSDPDIDFRVYEEECHAMLAKAKHEKKIKDKDKENRAHISVGVEAYTHSKTDTVEFRGPFYQEQAVRRENREQSRPLIPREHPPGWTPEAE
ncbi:MAG: hypothetical protein K0Q52_120 [Microbacterium sp.]|jgi:hypothetical protein|nr:hypothetical protein [Microbacterium sp.]